MLKRIKHTCDVALEPLLGTILQGRTHTFGSDAGNEFLNGNVDELLRNLKINRVAACADDQSQNGLAERTIGVLFEMVRTLMSDAELPLQFWGECLLTCNYLRNRLPTAGNKFGASPFELRYGRRPNLKNLRPFGARCTVLKHKNKRGGSKAQTRGLKGILVGYAEPFGRKGYRVYIPSLRRVVMSPNLRVSTDKVAWCAALPKME